MITSNLNIGPAFKKLRLTSGVKSKDLESVMSKSSLATFESGKNNPSFEKVAAALDILGFTISDLLCFSGYYKPEPIYGTTFHSIRVQRGYQEDFFQSVGISPMRLILFEQGKILLAYSSVDAMLSAMRVPEGDFEYALTGQENYFIATIDKLNISIRKKDFSYIQLVEKSAIEYSKLIPSIKSEAELLANDNGVYTDDDLEKYSDETPTRQYMDYRVLELTAKSAHCHLSEEEQIEIVDFLFGISFWAEYSLGILSIMAAQLPYITIHAILSDFTKDKKRYAGKMVYRIHVTQAGTRAALNQAIINEFDNAEELLSLVKPFTFGVDTASSLHSRFS